MMDFTFFLFTKNMKMFLPKLIFYFIKKKM